MPMIAGVLELTDVLDRLRAIRPAFHSEADFQYALGQVIHDMAPDLQVRLEVKQTGRQYLDILVFGDLGRTAIELKYPTRRWIGRDPAGEQFQVANHAATDLGRQGFVFDIARLESFSAASLLPTSGVMPTNGLAILITNEPSYWTASKTSRVTRDANFRIHEGSSLTGILRWGDNDVERCRRELRGSYTMTWQPWSDLGGAGGEFRWVAVEVAGR